MLEITIENCLKLSRDYEALSNRDYADDGTQLSVEAKAIAAVASDLYNLYVEVLAIKDKLDTK